MTAIERTNAGGWTTREDADGLTVDDLLKSLTQLHDEGFGDARVNAEYALNDGEDDPVIAQIVRFDCIPVVDGRHSYVNMEAQVVE